MKVNINTFLNILLPKQTLIIHVLLGVKNNIKRRKTKNDHTKNIIIDAIYMKR